MNFKIYLALIILSFCSLTNSQGQSKISAITAKLFYNENNLKDYNDKDLSGTFSGNILDDKTITLRNTIIGEGYAKEYSNQTIVIVEIYSTDMSNKDQVLKLTASANNKVFLQQQKTFSCIEHPSKYKLLFLLDDTGCQEITLNAELILNNKIISKLVKLIKFECGE